MQEKEIGKCSFFILCPLNPPEKPFLKPLSYESHPSCHLQGLHEPLPKHTRAVGPLDFPPPPPMSRNKVTLHLPAAGAGGPARSPGDFGLLFKVRKTESHFHLLTPESALGAPFKSPEMTPPSDPQPTLLWPEQKGVLFEMALFTVLRAQERCLRKIVLLFQDLESWSE